jgi:hypothetical protein
MTKIHISATHAFSSENISCTKYNNSQDDIITFERQQIQKENYKYYVIMTSQKYQGRYKEKEFK